ncbi:MAG: hypothetical protein H6720_03845 [Sandaracinus sp.]|nr:hypothetical protein [Sandaracinus sp.]
MRFLLVLSCLVVACGDDDSFSDAGTADASVGCTLDVECDDGSFCNGAERCVEGATGTRTCVPSEPPCTAALCDETADRCTSDCSTPDADGDGAAAIACGGDDCDDTNAEIGPERTEICDEDGVDEDCDPTTVGMRDADGDGAIDALCCNGTRCGTDCDDARADVLPGATEACNDRDDDCDGSTDEGLLLESHWPDVDRDGHGDRDATPVMACARPAGYASDDLDCNDADVDVAPGAAERCNGADDDCDGNVDELEGNVFYRDADGDGWGDATDAVERDDCEAPDGYVGRVGDCDDTASTTHPGATETCNGVDDDCSSLDAPGGVALDEDADGDLHAPTGATCTGGYPRDDCDDGRPTVYAGAVEICSGLDEDCDETIDESTASQCASGVCDDGCYADRTLELQARAACALSGGAAYCWGVGSSVAGQANLVLESGVEMREVRPRRIAELSSLRSIGTSSFFGCALQADRLVVCWGANQFGQLGVGDTAPRDMPVVVPGLSDVVQLAVGDSSVCALQADGTVRCWGDNFAGQIGDETLDQRASPTSVHGVDRAVELVASGYTFCARRYDDSVWCWGGGTVGDGSDFDRSRAVRVVASGARQLASGGDAFNSAICARFDAGWQCWGLHSTLGVEGSGWAPEPFVAAAGVRVPVHADVPMGCAILDDATVACWGSDDSRVGGPEYGGPRIATAVAVPGLTDVVELQCGDDVCCASDGTTWSCFGLGNALAMGDGPRDVGPFRTAPAIATPRALAFGRDAGCAIDGTGALFCFGSAGQRALGFVPGGSSWVYPEPVEVSLPFEAIDVRSYEYRFCALGADGRVACWGGDQGPGDGTTVGATTPALVDASSMGDVRAIAVGLDFSCALAEADGSVWCWGITSGARTSLCGDGGTGCTRPVRVAGGRSYTTLSAGRSHACARSTDGEAWCWGFPGTGGALGDGTTSGSSSTPVRSGSASDVLDVSSGRAHTCVLHVGGTVSCVGTGGDGQLGGGDTSSSTTYVDVAGLTGVSALRCHSNSCFARRADGSWAGWGADRGLLGTSGAFVADRTSPTDAAYGATGSLWSGFSSACAVTSGSLRCWGTAGSSSGGPLTSGVRQRALPTRGSPELP